MKQIFIKYSLQFLMLLFVNLTIAQTISIADSLNQEPIPYATVSFGNGLGNFADEEGKFSFSKEKYSDVDTLFISAMGYAEKAVLTTSLPETILLKPEVSQLSEVVVSAPKNGKFKLRKRKPISHTDIFTSWLPTVESEVAILFKRYEGKPSQISKILLPINAESKYKSKGKGKFATIFRINFYENQKGLPGDPTGYENVVFSINEKEDKVFELDLSSKTIYIPENGIFISLQVLGYANSKGKLAQTKQYREIKTARGVQKISTSFRPLLPFTNQLVSQKTYVRRIFLNNKKWQIFDKSYNEKSKLIQTGHRNYGMGAEFKVYEN
ncbi:carboxypeptidase-like regulatory domain-containing protein [Maribacter sp. 2308TA10-17]|uniref:carboxypeptidase-like regulatory domain-containing protein n=1 Tax=Maribacter sp. 2308TA10-17 TaxID=3386276 RepID=UPI0039BD6181